jgi:hypothetical protein
MSVMSVKLLIIYLSEHVIQRFQAVHDTAFTWWLTKHLYLIYDYALTLPFSRVVNNISLCFHHLFA